ncbi:MAG: LuxR C-terminal-related transcriptional regulator [Kineosporiaceae bacterium]
MASVRLPEQDLRAVLDLAEHCRATAAGTGGATEVLDAVTGLVRCDVAFWNWIGPMPQCEERALVSSSRGREVVRMPRQSWLEHLHEHPIMSARHGLVTAISDVFSQCEFRRTWLYQEVFRVVGLAHEIGVALPRPDGELSVVVLSRGPGRDFSERDHLVLRLLRPHLGRALHTLADPAPRLTARQKEILRLVAEGLTDAHIARRLGLSHRTVGKHLENVYAVTGTHSRLQAITRVGLAPSDGALAELS